MKSKKYDETQDQRKRNESCPLTSRKKDKYMLFAGWEVRIVKNWTEVLKMLPEAAGREHHFPIFKPEATVFHYADLKPDDNTDRFNSAEEAWFIKDLLYGIRITIYCVTRRAIPSGYDLHLAQCKN